MATDEVIDYVERLTVMRVAVDAIDDDRIGAVAQSLVGGEKRAYIVLLRWWDFMRARWNKELRSCVQRSLAVPVSRSVVMATRFLTRHTPTRYMPFDLVVRVLTAMEEQSRSVYLLGGTGSDIRIVERNVRETFPGLRIVGRYSGHFPRHMEPSIITAIRKASPDLLLIGAGVPGRELWSFRHEKNLSTGLCLYSAEVFDMFAERRPRTSRRAFRRGLDFVPELFRRPWRLIRFFPYLWFILALVVFRVFSIR